MADSTILIAEQIPRGKPRSTAELAWLRFRRSTVGTIGAVILIVLYLITLLSPFLAP